MESKSRERSLKNASTSKSDDAEMELRSRCRNTPLSKQPTQVQEIRIHDRKE